MNNGKKTSDIKAVFLVIIILKLKGDIFIKIKDDEKMIKGHVQQYLDVTESFLKRSFKCCGMLWNNLSYKGKKSTITFRI